MTGNLTFLLCYLNVLCLLFKSADNILNSVFQFYFIEFFDLDKDIKAIIVEILLRILLNYANGEFNLILVFREIYDHFVLLTFYFENLS